MHVILIPIGSAGDVYPFIGMGEALKKRGHRVTLLSNDYFRQIIEAVGIEFESLSTTEKFKTILEDPRLWHPTRAFEFLARQAFLPLIPVVYNFIKERHVPGDTLVVASSLALGARVAQD